VESPVEPSTHSAKHFDGHRVPSKTAQSIADLQHAGGAPLPRIIRRDFEEHLGQDLDEVRIHTGETPAKAARQLQAKAFTLGHDVVFGANQFRPDTTVGKRLLAHELTHVVQQRNIADAGQPAPRLQRAPEEGTELNDGAEPDDASSNDVETAPFAGNVNAIDALDASEERSAFMDELRSDLEAMVDEELGQYGWSGKDCPWITWYIERYRSASRDELNQLADKWLDGKVPLTIAAFRRAIVERARKGVRHWAAKGGSLPSFPTLGDAAPPPMLRRWARPSGGSSSPTSVDTLTQLGPGEALSSSLAQRFSKELGGAVSNVRVHHDASAASSAAEVNAHAFSVGEHIAFGAGRFAPGTVFGDALLAHELAHARGIAENGTEGDAEAAANAVALSAVSRLHFGNTDAVPNPGHLSKSFTPPQSKGGLRLRRCSTNSASTVAPPVASASSGARDLMANTALPSATQQSEIESILNPTFVAGGTSRPFIAKNFDTEMRAAINKWMNAHYANAAALDRGGPAVQTLDMPQVRKTGEAAQAVVKDKWGAYITAAAPDPHTAAANPSFDIGSPAVLHRQEESIDPLPKADQDAIVVGLVEYAIRQQDGGQPVTRAHNVDQSRTADFNAVTSFIDSFVKVPSNYKKLVQIQRMWPGEEHPRDHTVYIQLKRWKDPSLASGLVDAQARLGYWSSFQTLIHEYIHAAAHANFSANAGSGQKRQVLIEGADDWLVTKLWSELEPKLPTSDALREKVEGKPYKFDKTVIPPLSRYDEWKDVEQIVQKLGANGEANLVAAYFLGQVQLIGQGNLRHVAAATPGVYDVLVDDFSLATVAERTFVDEATIRAANGLGSNVDRVKKGPLKVPGITYHLFVPHDDLSSIAKQHGVTEDALRKANPLVSDWSKLETHPWPVLIPKH
jgi:hypothetical protein